MPCLSTCPDGTHHCAMVHEHGGDHAASGCRWAESRLAKRAEVWRDRSSTRPTWCAGTCHWRDRVTGPPIHLRPDYMDAIQTFPTYTAALAHALASVGLTPTNPEEEQS